MPRDGSATRDRLLAAASALFVRHPVAAVSLREITALAGVGNTAAVHQHFGSRAGLESALVAKVQPSLNATRARAAPTPPPHRAVDAPALRPLVAALVEPVATLLDGPYGPGVLRLVAHALAESADGTPAPPWLAGALGTDDPATAALLDGIGAAHPFGPVVWSMQLGPLRRVLWSELSHRAVCEAAPRAGARAPAVAALVDALVAPLVVDPSAEFRRAAGLDLSSEAGRADEGMAEGGTDDDHDTDTGGLADRFREATQGIRRPTLPSLSGRTPRPGRTPRATRSPGTKRQPDDRA